MFNVNHFIVSQVNPHVVPFLVKDDEAITKGAQSDRQGPGWVYTLTNLAKDEVLHRMHVLAELGVFPNLVTKARSVLSQKYSGDITILPQIDYKDFPRMLKNPTTEFMLQSCLCGERATWPKLSMIRNHCAVEIELDSAVQKLRARVVFSPSQVDLRRMTTGSFHDTSKRRRRDSGGELSPGMESLSKIPNSSDKPKKAASRPGLKGSISQWSIPRRYQQPLLGPRSVHATPSHPREIDPFNLMQPLHVPDLHIPDLSSATETAYSPPTSDADVDSLTEDSTPDREDPALNTYRNAKNQAFGISDEIDFFSNSQPVTSRADYVMATSPLSKRAAVGMSPIVGGERRKLGEGVGKENVP
ncbi:hypothetical protein M7I_2933 [Glarea lozoyensis 74030]|nr:hypothetical protein M7I_2933 [Glarea lozoyensis 74030]